MKRWHITGRRINEVVIAADQFAAWNTLRLRPVGDFGLVTTAEANENGNPIPIKTSSLMERWGRADDARRLHELAVEKGLE